MTDFADFILQVSLSAEPGAQPRRLADRRAASRPRRSTSTTSIAGGRSSCRRIGFTTAAAATRSIRARTRGRGSTPASSAPTASCPSSSRPRSSRSRTCGTCTPRSACSAARRTRCSPAPSCPSRGPATDQVRGFGFQHDGSLGQLEHFFTGQVFMKATMPVTLQDGTVVPPNPYGIPFVDPNASIRARSCSPRTAASHSGTRSSPS